MSPTPDQAWHRPFLVAEAVVVQEGTLLLVEVVVVLEEVVLLDAPL
jgi:hypothetical protein